MYDTLDYLWRLVRDYADDPRYHNVALAFAAHLNAHEQALTGACCPLYPYPNRVRIQPGHLIVNGVRRDASVDVVTRAEWEGARGKDEGETRHDRR